jgi:hypothetical protein
MKTLDHIRLAPTEQHAHIDWRNRSFQLSYWSEKSDEKETLLGGLMAFLAPQKYFIVPDTGWSDWDLKIARGLWSRALVMVVAENHGGVQRLLRVRVTMRLSRLSAFVLRSYAVVTAAALILGDPVLAALTGAAGIANFGFIAYRTASFGGLMHRIVETVAKQADLKPLAPIARDPLPIGGPSTASP